MAVGNNRKASPILISIVAASVVGVLAVSIWLIYKPTPNPAPTHLVKLNPNAKVVDKKPLILTKSPKLKAVTYKPLRLTDNEIEFSGAKHDIAAGAVLLSNGKGYAYCRKVESVHFKNGRTICKTKPATIKDAYTRIDGQITPGFDRNTTRIQYIKPVKGITFKWVEDAKTQQDPLEIDFNDAQVAEVGASSDSPFSFGGHVTLTAKPDFTPDEDGGFEATFDTGLEGNVNVTVNAHGH